MIFEKIAVDYGKETEADGKGNYEITITIGIKPSEDIIPPFSKDITVKSNNSMTGYEVDSQRKTEIENFLLELNK